MTKLYQREREGVNTLYRAGARLFRLTDENRPAESKGFFDRQLSLDDLLEHLKPRTCVWPESGSRVLNTWIEQA